MLEKMKVYKGVKMDISQENPTKPEMNQEGIPQKDK